MTQEMTRTRAATKSRALMVFFAATFGVFVACSTPEPPIVSHAGRYQIVHTEGAHVVRLDTHTGDMVAFLIGPPELLANAKQRLGGKYIDNIRFIEWARFKEEAKR
jgi:hypothetical protein